LTLRNVLDNIREQKKANGAQLIERLNSFLYWMDSHGYEITPVFHDFEKRKIGVFHISSLAGEKCLRRLQYIKMKVEPSDKEKALVDPVLLRTFSFGIIVHSWFQTCYEEMVKKGFLYKFEREVNFFDSKRKILGHADGVFELEKGCEEEIFELKSITAASFAYLKEAKDVHKIQAYLYARQRGCKKVRVQYYCKDWVAAVRMPKSTLLSGDLRDVKEFCINRNDEIVDRIFDGVDLVLENIRDGRFADRFCKGTKDSTAKSCPWCSICFSDTRFEELT